MRSGYSEEIDDRDLAMWRGRVASAMRGKRGQKFLRECLAALDEMPYKQLIRDDLVDEYGDVCLLGACGRRLCIQDLDKIDPEDHDTLAAVFDVAPCLIQEIEYINDDACWSEIPEHRYKRVRQWIIDHLRA